MYKPMTVFNSVVGLLTTRGVSGASVPSVNRPWEDMSTAGIPSDGILCSFFVSKLPEEVFASVYKSGKMIKK